MIQLSDDTYALCKTTDAAPSSMDAAASIVNHLGLLRLRNKLGERTRYVLPSFNGKYLCEIAWYRTERAAMMTLFYLEQNKLGSFTVRSRGFVPIARYTYNAGELQRLGVWLIRRLEDIKANRMKPESDERFPIKGLKGGLFNEFEE